MIDVVYAMGTEIVTMSTGQTIPVQKGTHWPADDPIVKARPYLFSRDNRYGMFYTAEPEGYNQSEDAYSGEVESATANPGEKRSVRRERS
jgi:hypothetical protein